MVLPCMIDLMVRCVVNYAVCGVPWCMWRCRELVDVMYTVCLNDEHITCYIYTICMQVAKIFFTTDKFKLSGRFIGFWEGGGGGGGEVPFYTSAYGASSVSGVKQSLRCF